MPYYPYFFTLKCHLRVKIQNFFPRSLRLFGFYKITSMFIQGARRLTPQFFYVKPKSLSVWLVLLSQVLSCPFNLKFLIFKQLVVMNFIFGKALLSLHFYTDNPYFFTTFSKFLSLLFPYFSVDGHLKACFNIKMQDG